MTANDLAAEVGDAMAAYLKAKAERDEMCDGTVMDWGYWGARFDANVAGRAAELGQALDAFTERRRTDGT